MAKGYLPYNPEQQLLLPTDMRKWVPEGHLALFVLDLVRELDLSGFYQPHREKDSRGRAGYDPMMMALLLYGYCTGMRSSRRIEMATYEDVAFRLLSGDQHPDHDSIASFRRQHLSALAGLFHQALKLCAGAGLVKMGHVSLDGTKMKAAASKHKAMSYERMKEAETKLEAQIDELMAAAEQADTEEDARYGKGKRGDELPEELKRRESRLQKIREAKAALEAQAREKAEEREREAAESGKKPSGRPAQTPDPEQVQPDPKAQRNFTDPDSRIMPEGANKGSFLQGYNAQAVVDAEAQIIVAADVTQQANDKQQLVPMVMLACENMGGISPDKVSADAGYFSEASITDPRLDGMDLYVPPNRQKHGEAPQKTPGETGKLPKFSDVMRAKLATPEGEAVYKRRKAIVEPVFGQIKHAQGIRGLLLRGLELAKAEWQLICTAHNLRKLFVSGLRSSLTPQPT